MEHLGDEIGVNPTRVEELLTNPEDATDREQATAQAMAREEYLACLLIIKSDPQ